MHIGRMAHDRSTHKAVIGFCAFAVLWFSIWTITVNVFVLSGSYFAVLPWCLLSTTMLSLLAAILFLPRLLIRYPLTSVEALDAASSKTAPKALMLVIVGFGSATTLHFAQSTSLTIIFAAIVSITAYLLFASCELSNGVQGDRFTRDLIILTLVILSLYYFGHRPDGDDANYLNLSAKAPVTHGHIFQLDTMVGDGPHPIHLPTYRVQSYELLGAVLSFLTGFEPIQVAHLLLPFVTLLLFTCALGLSMRAVVGYHWLAASLFVLGYMYADTLTYTSWGINGLVRFQQAKGPLATLAPLVAASLTVRWFTKRQLADLAALTLVHICAIGLSANGLFISPAASGFVALAFLISSPVQNWRAALKLVPTLVYPAAISAIVLVQHLGLPSEVTSATQPLPSLEGVVGWRVEGLLLLALVPMLAIVPRNRGSRLVAAIYLPAALLLVMNPFGWAAASAVTGNLGFRMFWAIPGTFIAGAVSVRLLEYLRLGSRSVPLLLGSAALFSGCAYNRLAADPAHRISWHSPGLRVDHPDYEEARSLAAITPANCKALVPVKYATWMSGLKKGPYLVTVTSLYLTHYRLSEPRDEVATRWKLFNLINGKQGVASVPSNAHMRDYDMRVGLVASEASNRNLPEVRRLAAQLGLAPVANDAEPAFIWVGPCRGTSQRF